MTALIRTFRYPLRPTAAQEAVLLGWLGQCCDLYNAALQERRDAWRKQRASVGLYDQCKGLTEWRQSDSVGAAVPVEAQRSALRRVDLAFKAFFCRCKAGQTPGFPRFRSKRRYGSFSVPRGATAHPNFRIDGPRIDLPKLSGVKIHLYRPLRGKVLQVTVRREAGNKWSVSFACDLGAAPPLVSPATVVGIDVGLRTLAVTSDGEVIENPRHAARGAAKLARVQRVAARRKRGSRSKERARIQVAKAYAHVANQRLDHARKVAATLVPKYDVVAHEDLNIAGMAKGWFSKSINNAGWGILLRCIALKAESAGKHVVAVDPRHTSQACSRCGALVPKDLGVRVHDCPHCGLRIDRDWNAAINICALGRSAVSEASAPGSSQARRSEIPILPLPKTHPEVIAPAWEVAVVQHNDARDIGGKHVEAGESLPGANAFGQKAWAPVNEAAARAKFGEVVASEARRVAAKEAA